jgi:ankyrin repeat protein
MAMASQETTPPSLAARLGHLNILQRLLDGKANGHLENVSLLDLAAQEGHFEVVHYLLTTEQFSKEPVLCSAIAFAASKSSAGRQEMIQLLLKSGVSQHALNKSLVALAASTLSASYGECPITSKELEDLLATMAVLLKAGSDSGYADFSTDGFTALHHLARRQDVTTAMQLLLEYGAPPNDKD